MGKHPNLDTMTYYPLLTSFRAQQYELSRQAYGTCTRTTFLFFGEFHRHLCCYHHLYCPTTLLRCQINLLYLFV